MSSDSARCNLASTTTIYFSACFSPWTLGFQLCGLQDWRQELGSLGKAAVLHLRTWVDFVKDQEQQRLFELWGNELCFLFLNRILLYDGCFECECSRLFISEVLLLQMTSLLS